MSGRILDILKTYPGGTKLTDPTEIDAAVEKLTGEPAVTRRELNDLIRRINNILNVVSAQILSSIPGADLDTPIDLDQSAAAPGLATSVTAVGGPDSIMLRWINPSGSTNEMYDVAEIHRSDDNDSDNSSLVGEVRGTAFLDGGRTAATAYFYWLKIRGFNGTVGSFHAAQTSGATATTD